MLVRVAAFSGTAGLLVYHFDLLVDYLPGEPVDRAVRVYQLSTINCQPSPTRLFGYFFKLRAEHVHVTAQSVIARGSIRMNKIATERDVKPVSLLTFDHKVATG
jgi:hypothetical protein